MDGGQRMFRSPAWLLLDDHDELELYSKPDDHWEVNEVARRCRSEAQQMHEGLQNFLAAAKANDRSLLQALSADLFSF